MSFLFAAESPQPLDGSAHRDVHRQREGGPAAHGHTVPVTRFSPSMLAPSDALALLKWTGSQQGSSRMRGRRHSPAPCSPWGPQQEAGRSPQPCREGSLRHGRAGSLFPVEGRGPAHVEAGGRWRSLCWGERCRCWCATRPWTQPLERGFRPFNHCVSPGAAHSRCSGSPNAVHGLQLCPAAVLSREWDGSAPAPASRSRSVGQGKWGFLQMPRPGAGQGGWVSCLGQPNPF